MRCFYYLECEEQDKMFKYLDDQVNEGYIDYTINENDGIIKIKNVTIENDDDLYNKLDKWDLIEDEFEDLDEDYDDFFNEEDFEV